MLSLGTKLTLMTALVLGACSRSEDSQLRAVFGTSDITLAKPISGQPSSAAGSIQAVLADPNGGPRFALPFCSGFLVSRRHMMTASHCVQRDFIFNQSYVANQDGQISYVRFGKTLRLNYIGGVDPQSQQNELSAPVFKDPVFIDRDLDVAVFDLGDQSSARDWVNLESVSDSMATGELYAYPNGAPLTKVTCRTGRLVDGSRFMHDCDAMTGSSGGLIVSLPELTPVAMHLAGPGANDADYYDAHREFESPEVFAERRGCSKSPADKTGLDADCQLKMGYNRGVALTAVADALKKQNPDLWQSIRVLAQAQKPQ